MEAAFADAGFGVDHVRRSGPSGESTPENTRFPPRKHSSVSLDHAVNATPSWIGVARRSPHRSEPPLRGTWRTGSSRSPLGVPEQDVGRAGISDRRCLATAADRDQEIFAAWWRDKLQADR